MANIVVVSGQFNSGGTSFAGSPVIIKVDGLSWPKNPVSPFTTVVVEVLYGSKVVGEFKADTGGQTSIRLDISSALRAIWSDYTFSSEVTAAGGGSSVTRPYRSYTLRLSTEYLSADGVFTTSTPVTFPGGSCAIGWLTELERSKIGNADMSTLQLSNLRFGDASTKPLTSPEIVGRNSITSWVDLGGSGTVSHFYAANATMGADNGNDHAPTVLRDTSREYVDFLFVNRRGAVETCSGLMKEAMDIEVTTTQYARVERPSFAPSRSLMAIASGGRRSWSMSSGYQTREWAEWWTQEFLMARQWWMKYPVGDATGTYVPVIVTPSKKSVSIYDRTKQQMPHVDFTVTLALEG
jgi:hypothetical protein